MVRRIGWSGAPCALLAVGVCAAGARADELSDLRGALWGPRGGAATPEGRSWGLAVGRASGDQNPLVFATTPSQHAPGAAGTRVRATDLEAVRLQFPDQAAAEGFAARYWDAVQQAGNGRFYPQQLEVRGRDLILVEGSALNDAEAREEVFQAVKAGVPGEPSVVARSPRGRPEPLKRPGMAPALARTAPGGGAGPSAASPTPSGPGSGGPGGGPGGGPARGPAAGPGGEPRTSPGQTANEAGPAGATDWQSWHRGIALDGVPIPRAGLANGTLRRALGRATEPHGQVVTHQGKQFVGGKCSSFGGPRDTGVSASETGAITGERLRSLNSPLNPTPQQVLANAKNYYYVAMRFDYGPRGKSFWAGARLLVVNPRNGRAVVVRPVDWGPNTNTGRTVDLSPTSMGYLGLSTDGQALVAFAAPNAPLGPLR